MAVEVGSCTDGESCPRIHNSERQTRALVLLLPRDTDQFEHLLRRRRLAHGQEAPDVRIARGLEERRRVVD
jgi:hypothetical protein